MLAPLPEAQSKTVSLSSPMLPPAALPAYDASQKAAPLSQTAPGAPETHPREKEASAEEAAAADAADIIKCAFQHLDIMTLTPAYTQQPDFEVEQGGSEGAPTARNMEEETTWTLLR